MNLGLLGEQPVLLTAEPSPASVCLLFSLRQRHTKHPYGLELGLYHAGLELCDLFSASGVLRLKACAVISRLILFITNTI